MNYTSIVKRIDNLGRIVLPKEIRRKLKLRENDEVEIILNDESSVILKKYSAITEYEKECVILANILDELVENNNVLITDNFSVLVCGKKEYEYLVDRKLSKKFLNILQDRKIFTEKISPTFDILDMEEGIYAKIIVPIIVDSAVSGSVVIFSRDKNTTVRDKDIDLVKFASLLLSSKIKI
mgnify:CR=1 FL=1